MDESLADRAASLDRIALDWLMPMHLALSASGHVTSAGSTLIKMLPDQRLMGRAVFDVFDVRRPGGVSTAADLVARAGQRLHLHPKGRPDDGLRGVAMPMADGQGLLINLSFGIGVIDAVRRHALTDADFAATDLTIELLYLVEAKTAVTEELKGLNLRLQGAKVAAEEQALTDPLTGLRNRRAADLRLDHLCGGRRAFGVMHLDLDFFKAVNDTLGHAAGDHVLREVAQVLRDQTRTEDCVARIGGDEFLIILPGLADAARLRQIADRVIAQITRPIRFEGQQCRVSASIGMGLSTLYRKPDMPRLLQDLDTALYRAKHAGREQAIMAQGEERNEAGQWKPDPATASDQPASDDRNGSP